jgi:hypothetical protein
MYNNGNSSKNVTGASIVDGTVETVDIADDAVTADKLANTVNTDIATGVTASTTAGDALPKAGGAMTGAITTNSTFDGVDVATRDAVLTSTTNTADAALPKAGGTMTGTIADFISTGILDEATSKAIDIDSNQSVVIGSSVVNPASGFSTIGAMGVRNDGRTEIATTADGLAVLQLGINSASNASAVVFRKQGTVVGSISVTGSATSYNTSSDYRLKENVVPMTGSVDRLKALNPSRFNFISDSDTTVDGFLAHEAGEVVPECATGTKDAMKTEEYEVTPAVMDGETVVTEAVMGEREVEDYQGIDQSKLVPLLVSALQEAITRIEQLENN